MKCPYRMDEVHTCHDGKTWIYREFADCYGKICPYWHKLDTDTGVCLKVEKEC